MPRPRFDRADPKKRDALLDAAAREFAEHGYDGASTNRILVAAGFSKGAFYYYFDDKDDLAAAVLEREAGKFLTLFDSLPPIHTAEEFWAAVNDNAGRALAQMRQSQQTSDALTRLGTAMAQKPEILARCGPLIATSREKLGALWKRGQEVGAVRTDLPLDTLLAMLQGIKLAVTGVLLPANRAASGAEMDEFARVHFDLMRRASEARPPAKRAPRERAKTKKPEVRR